MRNLLIRTQKSSRWAAILLAAVVTILTSAVVANATQTITTPNAAFITFNLAAGASSAPITPVTNKSVQVMGCTTGPANAGVAHVTLLHQPSALLWWTGLEPPTSGSGGATITSGFTASAGTHMIYINFQHTVDIQVASADTIVVHNGSSFTAAGNVTLMW